MTLAPLLYQALELSNSGINWLVFTDLNEKNKTVGLCVAAFLQQPDFRFAVVIFAVRVLLKDIYLALKEPLIISMYTCF